MGLGAPGNAEEASKVVSGVFTAIGPSGTGTIYGGVSSGTSVPPTFAGLVNVAVWGTITATTITTTATSTSATVSSATGLVVGQTISNPNVVAGTTITVISGTTLTLSVAAIGTATLAAAVFSGTTFSGTVQLERSFDGGATFVPVSEDTTGTAASYTAAFNGQIYEAEHQIFYRWNCTAYSSGNINYRISQSSYLWTGGQ